MSWTKRTESARSTIFAVAILALAIAVMWSAAQFNTVEASDDRAVPESHLMFTGTGTGAIPDGPGVPTLCGPAGPSRDVTFNVTGVTGTITDIYITVDLTHTYTGDITATLIAPNSTSHVLFGRTGTTSATSCGEFSNLGGAYRFDDAATGTNWWTVAFASPNTNTVIAPGTYRTTAPGPQPVIDFSPVTSLNATFAGVTNPNGTWTLRVTDSGAGDTGSVNAATLAIAGGGGAGTPRPPFLNFFGTTRTDFAVFTFPTGGSTITWAVVQNDNPTRSNSNIISQPWGAPATDLVPAFGNYIGDSKVDFNLYRNSAGNPANTYQILMNNYPNIGTQKFMPFGTSATDIIGREGDYDGDGIFDLTVIRDPSDPMVGGPLRWFILNSATNTLTSFVYGTSATDIALPGADYTGNGRHDPTIIRIADNGDITFYVGTTSGTVVSATQWGSFATDFVIPGGDYDGDGRTDYAVWRGFLGTNGAVGVWYIRTATGATSSIPFGTRGDGDTRDIALRAGDYDGDGRTDVAVYRPSTRQFIVRRSSDMGTVIQGWGAAGNNNIPLARFGTF